METELRYLLTTKNCVLKSVPSPATDN